MGPVGGLALRSEGCVCSPRGLTESERREHPELWLFDIGLTLGTHEVPAGGFRLWAPLGRGVNARRLALRCLLTLPVPPPALPSRCLVWIHLENGQWWPGH